MSDGGQIRAGLIHYFEICACFCVSFKRIKEFPFQGKGKRKINKEKTVASREFRVGKL